MNFAEKLRELRFKSGMSQEGVAKLLGITRKSYNAYEGGSYPRNRAIYQKLAQIFKCDVNYLLTEDETFIFNREEQEQSQGRREAEQLVARANGMFSGGLLSDEDKDKVITALQQAYWFSKRSNIKTNIAPLNEKK